MDLKNTVSRRGFFGGLAAALGYVGLRPDANLLAQVIAPAAPAGPRRPSVAEYDALAKLANNENPYGPPESVMKAMNGAWKYANRYGYPDGGITAGYCRSSRGEAGERAARRRIR